MKLKALLSKIDGVFLPPVKSYYLGKIVYGTPYFWPMGFNSSILSIRKLIKNSDEDIELLCKGRPWLVERSKFKNLPVVRRTSDKIICIFGTYYFVQIGTPICMYRNELGWKDKYDSPRFEWPPAFYIFFFKWQFCIWWNAPDHSKRGSDTYYEMILWYLNYSDSDIAKACSTWPWSNAKTSASTWNSKYTIN